LLSRIEADDIIVNKIWARNGSVAVVSENLAGCYVSGEFPTFIPIRDKLEPRWFHWFTKTPLLWKQCDEKSRGTSGKNRIRPERFLEIHIPLPPLDEQRRIVARIDELSTKIKEARDLRSYTVQRSKSLWASALREAFQPSQQLLYSSQTAKDLLDKHATAHTEDDQKSYNGAHPWIPTIFTEGPYAIPKHWVWTNLGSVLEKIVDCINDTPDFSDTATDLLLKRCRKVLPGS
jgi:type I restriction enzyme, S subunit